MLFLNSFNLIVFERKKEKKRERKKREKGNHMEKIHDQVKKHIQEQPTDVFLEEHCLALIVSSSFEMKQEKQTSLVIKIEEEEEEEEESGDGKILDDGDVEFERILDEEELIPFQELGNVSQLLSSERQEDNERALKILTDFPTEDVVGCESWKMIAMALAQVMSDEKRKEVEVKEKALSKLVNVAVEAPFHAIDVCNVMLKYLRQSQTPNPRHVRIFVRILEIMTTAFEGQDQNELERIALESFSMFSDDSRGHCSALTTEPQVNPKWISEWLQKSQNRRAIILSSIQSGFVSTLNTRLLRRTFLSHDFPAACSLLSIGEGKGMISNRLKETVMEVAFGKENKGEMSEYMMKSLISLAKTRHGASEYIFASRTTQSIIATTIMAKKNISIILKILTVLIEQNSQIEQSMIENIKMIAIKIIEKSKNERNVKRAIEFLGSGIRNRKFPCEQSMITISIQRMKQQRHLNEQMVMIRKFIEKISTVPTGQLEMANQLREATNETICLVLGTKRGGGGGGGEEAKKEITQRCERAVQKLFECYDDGMKENSGNQEIEEIASMLTWSTFCRFVVSTDKRSSIWKVLKEGISKVHSIQPEIQTISLRFIDRAIWDFNTLVRFEANFRLSEVMISLQKNCNG